MVRKASQPAGCERCAALDDDDALCARCWMNRDVAENAALYEALAAEDE